MKTLQSRCNRFPMDTAEDRPAKRLSSVAARSAFIFVVSGYLSFLVKGEDDQSRGGAEKG